MPSCQAALLAKSERLRYLYSPTHNEDRNIISVPLSQIATNQQLQDIVFDQSFKVALPLQPACALLAPCTLNMKG